VHLLGVISVLTLFGQFIFLTLLFLVSLRSYGGGKWLKMVVMYAKCHMSVRLLEISQVSSFEVVTL
jgi:hypothetical protein